MKIKMKGGGGSKKEREKKKEEWKCKGWTTGLGERGGGGGESVQSD